MNRKSWALRSFLTGSYAYGEPTKDSDIDLVVFMSEPETYALAREAGESRDVDEDYKDMGGRSLRFGKLNILAFWDKRAYEAWRKGTVLLKQKVKHSHPVTRGYACKFLDDLFKKILPKKLRPRKKIERIINEDDSDERPKKKICKKNKIDDEDDFEF